MTTTRWGKGAAAVALGMVLAAPAAQAQEGWIDKLFGGSKTADTGSKEQRLWRLDEFTAVRLDAKEPGAPANQHPVVVQRAALQERLAGVQALVRGEPEPLFTEEELAQLTPVLVRALSLAAPGDDVLLLSTARRGGAFFVSPPDTLTARLFVHGDALHLIVHDVRLDFLQDYRRTRIAPKFNFGSRDRASKAILQSASAASRRADWVTFPLAALSGADAPPPAAAPARAAAPAAVPEAAAPPPPPPAPGSRAAHYAEQEERLVTLKRLRDRNLITEEEYQQKRREVLQGL